MDTSYSKLITKLLIILLYTGFAIVATSLAQWHKMIDTKDTTILIDLLYPDVVFRSPMAHRPYAGAFAVGLILQTVITIFENFT